MLGPYFFVALFCAATQLASAKVARHTDCSSVYNNASSFPCQVLEVRIEPCKNEAYCKIKLNEDASIAVDFIPGFDAEKLAVSVSYQDTKFPGLDSDACKGTTCPIKKGTKETFQTQLHIGAKLPTGKYDVYWKIENEANPQELCCFMTQLRLAKGKKK